MAGYSTNVVTVGTTATLIVTTGPAPVTDGLLIVNTGSNTAYIGNSAVTTATGFPVTSSSGIVILPTTGAEIDSLYGITSTGTTTVAYFTVT